jgi:hypothetical protein
MTERPYKAPQRRLVAPHFGLPSHRLLPSLALDWFCRANFLANYGFFWCELRFSQDSFVSVPAVNFYVYGNSCCCPVQQKA